MVITMILFLITNIIIWYQLNSQLVWEWAKTSKAMWFSALLGIPISLLFWWATKIGYEAFGNLWSIRFMGFATSMLTFPVMTYFYLNGCVHYLQYGMRVWDYIYTTHTYYR